MTWPNYTPPADIEIDGARHTGPIPPNPGPGPDTDLLVSVLGYDVGESPMPLLPPFRTRSDNAAIPAKGVFGIGPQTGDANNMLLNQGSVVLPGWQRYLEMAGQPGVGLLPRTVPVEHNELWDHNYVLNPGIEVI